MGTTGCAGATSVSRAASAAAVRPTTFCSVAACCRKGLPLPSQRTAPNSPNQPFPGRRLLAQRSQDALITM